MTSTLKLYPLLFEQRQGLTATRELPDSGFVTLYHFISSNNPPERITLDPAMFGKSSYSKTEKAKASTPRIFFYTDPEQKEVFFSSATMYTTNVPVHEIYNLHKDPANLLFKLDPKYAGLSDEEKEALTDPNRYQFRYGAYGESKGTLDYDSLLKYIKNSYNPAGAGSDTFSGYKGVFYKTQQFSVVIWFHPIEVTRSS